MQDDLKTDLVALCRQAAEQDGADVVILAGAPLAGLGTTRSVGRRPEAAANKPVTGVSDELQSLF